MCLLTLCKSNTIFYDEFNNLRISLRDNDGIAQGTSLSWLDFKSPPFGKSTRNLKVARIPFLVRGKNGAFSSLYKLEMCWGVIQP